MIEKFYFNRIEVTDNVKLRKSKHICNRNDVRKVRQHCPSRVRLEHLKSLEKSYLMKMKGLVLLTHREMDFEKLGEEEDVEMTR